MQSPITRRSLFKLGGAALAGLALPTTRQFGRAAPNDQLFGYGRCLMIYVTVYSRPSVYGRHLAFYPVDSILPIFEAVDGEDPGAHNPRWYRTQGGYVHASNVQPVAWRFHLPRYRLGSGGELVELTVPFVTARTQPAGAGREQYRLYYGSTYWAHDSITDSDGQTWYALWDDRISETYFAPAHTLRPVKAAELKPISPQVLDKWIHLDVAAQRLIAYEGETPVYEARMSSGRRYVEPDGTTNDYRTPLGEHFVYRKRPSRHMAAGDAAAPDSFDLPGVPWVSYFSGGMAFHGTYWHNDYGTPWSHGCVNLLPQDAKWIYRWTTPVAPASQHLIEEVGTRVVVV